MGPEADMRIHCDNCGAAIEKEDAIVHEVDEGEILYYCTEECYETAVDLGEDEDEKEDRAARQEQA
jgi:hypothetical protein